MANTPPRSPHSQCQLCQLVVRRRLDPQLTLTTCLWNETWARDSGYAARTGGSLASRGADAPESRPLMLTAREPDMPPPGLHAGQGGQSREDVVRRRDA